MLAKVFQAVDTIVSLHFNRNDTLTVPKLEEEVPSYNFYKQPLFYKHKDIDLLFFYSPIFR